MTHRRLYQQLSFCALLLLLTVCMLITVSAYDQNQIRKDRSEKQLAYEFGYMRGYQDALDGKGEQPLTTAFCYRRETLCSKHSYDEIAVAYWERGSYVMGYKEGYSNKLHNAPMKNLTLLPTYTSDTYPPQTIKESTVNLSKYTGKIKFTDIDQRKPITQLGYEIGYTHALAGIGSKPQQPLDDLRRDLRTSEAEEVTQWINDNRGVFVESYKKGYVAGVYAKQQGARLQSSEKKNTFASVKEKETAAYTLGCANAKADKEKGHGKRAYHIFSYDGKYFTVYTAEDIKLAKSAQSAYLNGYRACD